MTEISLEDYARALETQNKVLAKYLTALIKKYGKEQVIYAAGKSPGIELELTAEDLEASGVFVCTHV